MNEELEKGDIQSAKEVAMDIGMNLEKIYHHGQRASSIVRGMLEHSRAGNGEKELTDINALADEYLRLAYHGLRAKDKSFQAEFKSDFDKELPKIHVVPQDFGRVLLNLINNAFYTVDKKSKSGAVNYKPEVIIKTKNHVNSIELSVKDNGSGIPASIKDKIFQPFFTTKPAGQGTGLGLSISYDIITRGHNGSLEVKSLEGSGTEFIIVIPYHIN
jgi:signal transduction histidine kinase